MDFAALGQTLACGQCFRWRKTPDGAWEGVAGGRFLRLTEKS
ncbi:MAG TPA: DNA-(apurinic or apyrimidinic site) lyase, partial [Ruminococcaceae bacterium]|nr:DNA-(apurinic or apyrimidinic site) lyase [Oscillospiraceae bacterium]